MQGVSGRLLQFYTGVHYAALRSTEPLAEYLDMPKPREDLPMITESPRKNIFLLGQLFHSHRGPRTE